MGSMEWWASGVWWGTGVVRVCGMDGMGPREVEV